MQVENERIAQQQVETLDTLQALASHLANEPSFHLNSDTKNGLVEISKWLKIRRDKQALPFSLKSKASHTRLRLFCLQLEGLFEKLEHSQHPEEEREIMSRCKELILDQQHRALYEDMIACLLELSSLSIERGQGDQAIVFGDMASRLETRLECGHIVVQDDKQRAKDKALYADFKNKLKGMRT